MEQPNPLSPFNPPPGSKRLTVLLAAWLFVFIILAVAIGMIHVLLNSGHSVFAILLVPSTLILLAPFKQIFGKPGDRIIDITWKVSLVVILFPILWYGATFYLIYVCKVYNRYIDFLFEFIILFYFSCFRFLGKRRDRGYGNGLNDTRTPFILILTIVIPGALLYASVHFGKIFFEFKNLDTGRAVSALVLAAIFLVCAGPCIWVLIKELRRRYL